MTSPIHSLLLFSRLLVSEKIKNTFSQSFYCNGMVFKMEELEGQDVPLNLGFPISVGHHLHSLKIINTRCNSNFHS